MKFLRELCFLCASDIECSRRYNNISISAGGSLPTVTPGYRDGKSAPDALIYSADGLCYDGAFPYGGCKYEILPTQSGEFYILVDDIDNPESLTIHNAYAFLIPVGDITLPLNG